MRQTREEKEAKENKFKKFSTMTYSVSLYLQDPLAYERMMLTGKKDVTGLELLIQSGGIATDSSATGGNFGATRSRHFPQDFYLDDIQIESFISGTATGGATNSFKVNFTVTEPMGVTFTERLYNAATEYATRMGYDGSNPINQIYLMVIRFYGYDKDGKQIINGKFENASDPSSYMEKWIPIMITGLQFQISSSKVVYNCTCVCPQTQVAQGQMHGTVPFNVALQGGTVGELLKGGMKRNAKGVVTGGLVEALNHQQEQLKDDGTYMYTDTYDIEFEEGSGIEEALMSSKGSTPAIERSAMPGTATAQDLSKFSTGDAQVPGGKDGGTTFALNGGMKIAKFIDIAIRSSSFISSQYKKVNDDNKDGTTKYVQQTGDKPLKWFRINPKITIKDGLYDKNRKSVVYNITYVVSTYDVVSIDTRDFNPNNCYKTQKDYDYWFTGENTEVLKFEQNYNTLYFTTFSSKHLEDPSANPDAQANHRLLTQAPSVYKPTTSEKGVGENLTDEQAANAASLLYAPQDIVKAELDIVGDPDWLSQSELFYGPNTTRSPVLEDGSINYDVAEVFFSVNFNTVVDYDLNTGLADVTQKNFNKDLTAGEGGLSQYSFVYRANRLTTQLTKGKFVQQIQGSLVHVPEKCLTGQGAELREDGASGDGSGNGGIGGSGNGRVNGNSGGNSGTGGSGNGGNGKGNKPKATRTGGGAKIANKATDGSIRFDLDHAAGNVVTDIAAREFPLSGAAAREQFDPILNNLRNKGK